MPEETKPAPAEPNLDRELLLTELREGRMDTRIFFQLVVGWFTFFLSVMLAAIAWTAKAASEGMKNHQTVLVVSTFFVAQIVLGIVVCVVVRRYLTRATAAHARIEAALSSPKPVRVAQTDLDVSNSFMRHVLVVMMVTLAVYAVAWLVLPHVV
jgi:hypothetical protein